MKTQFKKVMAGVLALTLIITSLGAGISAYFTGTDKKSDSYTIGQIEIELVGDNDLYSATDLTPLEEYTFTRSAKNIGINDAFVYMAITLPYETVYTHNADGNHVEANVDELKNVQLFTYGNDGALGVNSEWTLVDDGYYIDFDIKALDGELKNLSGSHGAINSSAQTVTYVYAYTGSDASRLERLAPDAETSAIFDIMKFANVSDTVSALNIEAVTGAIKTRVYAIQADNILETTYMEGRNDDGIDEVNAVWAVINNAVSSEEGDNSNETEDENDSSLLVDGTTFNTRLIEAAGDASNIKSVEFIAPNASTYALTPTNVNVPDGVETVDVSLDGDGSVVAWDNGSGEMMVMAMNGKRPIANELSQSMFANLTNVQSINLSMLDTSNITNTSNMFKNCKNLTTVDASGLVTEKVTDISYMFNGCNGLTTIDVSSWDTQNVQNMQYVFNGCKLITELDVSGWNTSSVTKMNSLFRSCNNLIEVDVSDWDTSNVTDMANLFRDCLVLERADVSGWNTEKVKMMDYMFAFCKKLKVIDVADWETPELTSLFCTFMYCSSVEVLDLSNININNITATDSLFAMCSELKTIYANDWTTNTYTYPGSRVFADCYKLVGAVPYDSRNATWTMANPTTGYFTVKPTE